MAKNANKQQVKMPVKMTQRLTAAVAMLLVSTIMLVSATYAWFTLSTAPEVTGITTQVGANGNLEIALLDKDTFADPNTIQSAVGDSMDVATQTKAKANITWGNLVDLSDPSYGLSGIKLMPAALGLTGGKLNFAGSLLNFASYGKDGRVTAIDGATVAAAYDDGFKYDADNLTYGVRAIGATADISPRKSAFNIAKASVKNAKTSTLSSSTFTAVNNNVTAFIGIVMSGAETTKYTYDQIVAMQSMVAGANSTVNSIANFYANAIRATILSSAGIEDDALAIAAADEFNTSSAAALVSKIDSVTGLPAAVTAFKTDLTALSTLQTGLNTAAAALTTLATNNTEKVDFTAETSFDGDEATTDLQFIKTNVLNVLTGETVAYDAYKADVKVVEELSPEDVLGGKVDTLYVKSGAFATIAEQVGTFQLANPVLGVTTYAGEKETTSKLDSIKTTVTNLTYESGSTGAATITDTYGYVLDFAFRTNAADSKLKLQTAATNRVYKSETSEDLLTQGSGSNVTYTFDATKATNTQVETLLGAIGIVFFNPDDGTIYGQASLGAVTFGSNEATADVVLAGDEIVALQQNQPQKVSVLVYLDGTKVDNTAVLNDTNSGSLKLNLQFSSSADLVPMENTALKQMTE